MPIEKEIIGEITKELFLKQKERCTQLLGDPKIMRRLGLMVFDKNNERVDTRVRITNGNPEIMQKVTVFDDGKGHSEKQEIAIPLPKDPHIVHNAFLTYTNLLKPTYESKLIRLLVQTENYIWKTQEYELKLSYQFGKSEYYTYEIEALVEGVNLADISEQLGIEQSVNHASEERKLFRTTQVDLNADEIGEDEVEKIIKQYLA